MPLVLREEPPSFPNLPAIYADVSPPKVRVAVFGSFHGGYHVLRQCLLPPLANRVTVTGLATDDPKRPFTHANVRLWRHVHTKIEEEWVAKMARQHGIPVYRGRVKTPEFEQMFNEDWAPDLCLMATFGQMIPKSLFRRPRLGFYNFHHSDLNWPSYPGPDPIGNMIRDGKTHVVITLHEVSEVLDGGQFVAHSPPMPLPKDGNGAIVHRMTWPNLADWVCAQILRLLETPVVTLN
jgi:methionyl-tRNA formyltransferase